MQLQKITEENSEYLWHVRNKNNIDRVNKDEAKAAEEEKERQRKISLAEQESRTELLRLKSRKRSHHEIDSHGKDVLEDGAATSKAVVPSKSQAVEIYTPSGNINFFKDVESGEVRTGKNAEHEADAKAEKEKWEKDIGLLTYLGQSSVEKSTTKPWYLTTKTEKDIVDPVMKDRRLKDSLDPMRDMKLYLHKKKHKHKDKDKDREKHKSHKHRHKDKHKETFDAKQPHPSATKSIEQLRAERLKREQDERRRMEALLSKGKGEDEKVKEVIMDDRDRAYNSRYNPDYVRQPRDRHTL